MTCPSALPQPQTFNIRFASLVREAQNKHNSPFAGFSLAGLPPLVVPRKLLRSSIAGLTDAHVRVVVRAGQNLYDKTTLCNVVTGLEIHSLDGRRRYVLYSLHREIRTFRSEQYREVRKFAARKSSSLAAKNGWVRVVTFNEETAERSEVHEKSGLTIKGPVVFHAASGKSIAHADNRARAFVLAEAILAKYPDWTQDAESMVAMLGTEGIAECRRIEREVAA
jgi:hypothetical protein